MDLWAAGATELQGLYARGEASPVEALAAVRARIDRHDRDLGCFLLRLDEDAQVAARASEERYRAGRALGPLDGVPVGVKDNLCLRGQRTTAGSRILENYVATYDAHVVERLRGAGAVLVGKTNLDEFGMGSSSENSAFRPVRNPWRRDRVAGGSSGGSSAAVAAGFAPLALGSDTGGSVRQPAGFCGVLGLRPTYGSVSRHGLVAFASSLDQVGPLARDARDLALLLGVIAGADARDATCHQGRAPDYQAGFGGDLAELRVGVAQEYFGAGLDPEVEAAVRGGIGRLTSMGARPIEVSLPHTDLGIACYYILANSEASSNLARYDGVRYGLRVAGNSLPAMYQASRSRGFGAEVKRRIMLGTYALSAGYHEAFYRRAVAARGLIRDDFQRALGAVDVLVTPTSPTPAFAIGERSADPLAMYLSDVYTVPAALAGLPCLAVPAGFSAAGLPLSLQLIGRPFEEGRLLQVAAALAQGRAGHSCLAPLS